MCYTFSTRAEFIPLVQIGAVKMKTAIITGGAGGIGSAVCRRLAKNGYDIAIHYHTRQREAERLADEILNNYQNKVKVYRADLTDFESVATLFDNFSKDFASLDVLVNNAGKAQQKLFTDITPQEWRSMMGAGRRQLRGTLQRLQGRGHRLDKGARQGGRLVRHSRQLRRARRRDDRHDEGL